MTDCRYEVSVIGRPDITVRVGPAGRPLYLAWYLRIKSARIRRIHRAYSRTRRARRSGRR